MAKIITLILAIPMVGLWIVGLLLRDMQLLRIATILAGVLSVLNLVKIGLGARAKRKKQEAEKVKSDTMGAQEDGRLLPNAEPFGVSDEETGA